MRSQHWTDYLMVGFMYGALVVNTAVGTIAVLTPGHMSALSWLLHGATVAVMFAVAMMDRQRKPFDPVVIWI